jgi:hypothetical protein
MADTKQLLYQERLVASVWVHERQHTGQTMSQVMAAFREWFNKAPLYFLRKWFKSIYGSVLVGVRWLLSHPVDARKL